MKFQKVVISLLILIARILLNDIPRNADTVIQRAMAVEAEMTARFDRYEEQNRVARLRRIAREEAEAHSLFGRSECGLAGTSARWTLRQEADHEAQS